MYIYLFFSVCTVCIHVFKYEQFFMESLFPDYIRMLLFQDRMANESGQQDTTADTLLNALIDIGVALIIRDVRISIYKLCMCVYYTRIS